MTVRYSVTFEFPVRSPITHRGTVAGSQPSTCVSRATRIAQKALRPQGWSSMVCVLLERLDAEERADDLPASSVLGETGGVGLVAAMSSGSANPSGGDRV